MNLNPLQLAWCTSLYVALGLSRRWGKSTCNALLAFVTSVLHVAGVPHLVPCRLWLPLSGFPSGKPGA